MTKIITAITFLLCTLSFSQDYSLENIKWPKGAVLEVGDLKLTGDGKVYVCTRQGDVWVLKNGHWKKFAMGLQEPLGIELGGKGELYVLQRPELTRLLDENGDDVADVYHTFSTGWGFSANYHEYAMGLTRDKLGNFYFGLGLPYSRIEHNKFKGRWLGTMDVADRGCYLKVDAKTGEFSHFAYGVREPVGAVTSKDGDIFMTDTQGSFVATNYVIHVEKGDFLGHPDSLFWNKDLAEKTDSFLKIADLEKRDAEINKLRKRPVIYIPYREMGSSIGSIQVDDTNGKFGPFTGQYFIPDVIQPLIMRANFEKVKGVYQGAVFSFYNDVELGGGSLKLEFDKDGAMWIGQTARGWGNGEGLKKLKWNGTTSMDVKAMNMVENGFKISFTKPADEKTAADKNNYTFVIFKYDFTYKYNAKQMNRTALTVKSVKLADDKMSAIVEIDGLYKDCVVGFDYSRIKSAEGDFCTHKKAYYTINELK